LRQKLSRHLLSGTEPAQGNFMMVDSDTFFPNVKKHPDRFYIIHYSSQSLYDEGIDGLSPRITSIVVMHYATRQTLSFALHAEAEALGISKDDVESNYDTIEKALLQRFYSFLRDRREKYWIHWNMRNLTFGFEHLEHRYRSLCKAEPPSVPVEVRLNLNDILIERYGSDYAPSPRMKNLMLLNGELDVRFLEGAKEAEAFLKKEFIRMNNSTISKVEFFRHVISLAIKGKLRTAGRGFLVRIDRLLESRAARVIVFLAAVAAIISVPIAVYQVILWTHGAQ
jgi:hypothetical protein